MLHIHIRFSARAKALIIPSTSSSNRHQFSRSAFARRLTWLWLCLLAWAALLLHGQPVVINEIMFHPLQPAFGPEPVGQEFIELYNRSATTVDLNGWHFNKGITFTITNVMLAPGAYVVISPDTNSFRLRYPTVLNVVGNWRSEERRVGKECRSRW